MCSQADLFDVHCFGCLHPIIHIDRGGVEQDWIEARVVRSSLIRGIEFRVAAIVVRWIVGAKKLVRWIPKRRQAEVHELGDFHVHELELARRWGRERV